MKKILLGMFLLTLAGFCRADTNMYPNDTVPASGVPVEMSIIAFAGGQTTSVHSRVLTAVPTPAMLYLIAGSLVALGYSRRKRFL